jgi:hypothetical protein
MQSRPKGASMRTVVMGVVGVAILALVGGTAPAPAHAEPAPAGGLLWSSLPASFRAFDPTSPWNTPIPPDPRLDPASAAMMARLAGIVSGLKVDHATWSIPLFVIDARIAPLRDVIFTKDPNPILDPADTGRVRDVPMPDGIWPDPKPDGHMTLIDPRLRLAWDFSRLNHDPAEGWQASRVEIWDLDGVGYRPAFDGRRWWTRGARGSGLPLIGGLIRPEEIRAGRIDHALVFASPITRKVAFRGPEAELCPPASRTDGRRVGPDTLPMGVRVQLDPGLDLAAFDLSPEARVVARALQVYGMINGDSTHDVFKLYLQNLGPDGGAWADMDFSGLRRLPLDRFRVLHCSVVSRP